MKYLLTFLLALMISSVKSQVPDSTSFSIVKDSVTKVTFTKEVMQGSTRIITISKISGADSNLMQMYIQDMIQFQNARANDISVVSLYRKDFTNSVKSLRNFENELKYQSDSLFLKYNDLTKGVWEINKDGKQWKGLKFKLNNQGKIVLVSESKNYKVDYLYNVIRIYTLGENLEIMDLYLMGNHYISPCGRFVLKRGGNR